MITVENHTFFRGKMKVTPVGREPIEFTGEFRYEDGCWYHKDASYPEEICEVVEYDDREQ